MCDFMSCLCVLSTNFFVLYSRIGPSASQVHDNAELMAKIVALEKENNRLGKLVTLQEAVNAPPHAKKKILRPKPDEPQEATVTISKAGAKAKAKAVPKAAGAGSTETSQAMQDAKDGRASSSRPDDSDPPPDPEEAGEEEEMEEDCEVEEEESTVAAPPTTTAVVRINSSTHRAGYMRLSRLMEGSSQRLPAMAALWNGSAKDSGQRLSFFHGCIVFNFSKRNL